MGKIRTVKPELFRHEELYEAEKKYQLPLRLSFIGLFTCCDREGRFRWRPRQLKLDILPYDNVDMEDILNALVTKGFIVKYQVNDEMYGCIPSWHKHQCINHRETGSHLPSKKDGVILPATAAICPPFTPDPGAVDASTTRATSATDASSTSDSHFNDTQITRQGSINYNHNNPNKNNHLSTDASRVDYASTSAAATVVDASLTRQINARAYSGGSGKGKGREMEEELEKEGDCQGEGKSLAAKTEIVASPTRLRGVSNPVTVVFTHWKTVMAQPDAKLDTSRRNIIRKVLKAGYTPEQLCTAISGCSLTPHNMGFNDRGQRFDGLQLILRDADQIDRFIRHFHTPPQQTTATGKHTQANVQTLQTWVDKKLKSTTGDS